MGTVNVQVRAGTEGDLAALTELCNHYVRETAITFDTEPFTPEQRLPWLRSHPEDGSHRLLVAHAAKPGGPATPGPPPTVATPGATTASATLLGYATSSAFRPKAAYATSVEVSVYVSPAAAGRGIGSLLYERLFELSRTAPSASRAPSRSRR
ncbi:GNAT family N-acetyltransferase [Streptomyces sp. NPDC053493]|uniref:GNAT family N-acetyltransferase n=1 Tax=Streptomyces sp. NPDC053493 TaxID=3365705 RepID=UPI0037D0FC18